MNTTKTRQPLNWFKTLKKYYERPEWEFYDIKYDPEELNNIAQKTSVKDIFEELKKRLSNWQNLTNDPWICSPHAVLENTGDFKNDPQCLSLDN